jgi:hypothetical protein
MDQWWRPVSRSVTMRAVVVVLAILAASAEGAQASPNVGKEVARLLDHDDGYRAVVGDVLRWHRTRSRGCVAFVATALRHVGFDVPDSRPGGPWSNPARVTFSLDAYLAKEGWVRVAEASELVPGDLVFTDGAPDHVMVFQGWADRDEAIAVVSNKQRHRYRRPLRPASNGTVSRFAFARRAPPEAVASVDLDDHPLCQDVTLIRRRAGRRYLAQPGEVTCRGLVGAPGVVALVAVTEPELELPAEYRLIMLDGRRRLRARADLPGALDGYGGGFGPALVGGGDLGRDGRIEAWFENQAFTPMGSTTSTTIHLMQVRGAKLAEIGQVGAGWMGTIASPGDLAEAAGEHWEPEHDPARRITCHAIVTPRRDDLVISRELRRGSAVGTLRPPRVCEPTTVLPVRR